MEEIKFRNGVNLNEEQIKDIVSKYETHTSTELGLLYDVPRGTIKYIWTKNNKRGKLKTRYRCNWDYFEKIDTKDKAYFLGLMASDGNVHKKQSGQKYCTLKLQEQDKYILELFKLFLKSEKPIHVAHRENNNHSNIHSVEIVSDKMAFDLSKYNIIENKTYTYKPIILPKFMNHFIRGYFDGDGGMCIVNNLGNISSYNLYIMCGFESNVTEFKNYLGDIGIETKCFNDNRNYNSTESFMHLTATNVKQRYSFLKYIYEDCDDLCLLRKKEIANEYINEIENTKIPLYLEAIDYYNSIKNNFKR